MAGTRRSKIRKGDQVVVIAGRDRNKRGRVLEVLPAKGKIKVENIAIVKKHQRANSQNNRGGGIIDQPAFIDISNVQLIDPQSGKPSRARYEVAGDGTKTRVASKSGQAINK
ncbi:MAG: 50S ribosomal protein L24 [Pyrinomonadaceae bacterium]|nr:50S ribosomal protein L24 [Pyrinomonadaceae bacterium]